MSLDNLLGQVELRDKARVKKDINDTINLVGGVLPKIGTLIQNDGTEHRQITLSGTFQIIFRGQTYNIPLEIFVPSFYPHHPPKVYLRPTSNMIVLLLPTFFLSLNTLNTLNTLHTLNTPCLSLFSS